MKCIHILVPDELYEKLIKVKGNRTWRKFLEDLIAETEPKEAKTKPNEYTDRLKELEGRIEALERIVYSLANKTNDKIKEEVKKQKEEKEKPKEKEETPKKRPTPKKTGTLTNKQLDYLRTLLRDVLSKKNMRLTNLLSQIKDELGIDMKSLDDIYRLSREDASILIEFLKEILQS